MQVAANIGSEGLGVRSERQLTPDTVLRNRCSRQLHDPGGLKRETVRGGSGGSGGRLDRQQLLPERILGGGEAHERVSCVGPILAYQQRVGTPEQAGMLALQRREAGRAVVA